MILSAIRSDIPESIFTKIQCTRHIIAGQRAAAVPCEDCGMAGFTQGYWIDVIRQTDRQKSLTTAADRLLQIHIYSSSIQSVIMFIQYAPIL